MLPTWIERMSPRGRELLAYVARRAGLGGQASALGAVDGSAASRPSESSASRQARHAQLARARSTVAAGAIILGASEPEVQDFVLSRDFVWLRPFTSDLQFKWPQLAPLLLGVTVEQTQRMFERGCALVFDLAARLHTLDQADILRVHSAFLTMYPGPILFPRRFIEAWTEAWDEAEARGLLDNPHLRIRLGVLGGWVGTDESQIATSFDGELGDFALADAYCFVRPDLRADVFDCTAALIKGERLDPTACLLPTRPSTTIRQTVDYVRASFRDRQHLRTPGQALYLLTGLLYVEEHARRLRAEGMIGPEIDVVLERLRGFGDLQLMEKRRFWELCDRLPEGPSRQRMIALWQREFGVVKR